jgi:hypothetical protein
LGGGGKIKKYFNLKKTVKKRWRRRNKKERVEIAVEVTNK